MMVYAEGDTPERQADAERILFKVLYPLYPGHPWGVKVLEQGLFIIHGDFPAGWGSWLPAHKFDHSAEALKRQIMFAAGALLEMAAMPRGRYEDPDEIHVEGIPDRFQNRGTVSAEAVVIDSESRTEPRPQVTP